MKKIEVIVDPSRVSELEEALMATGVKGMTVSDTRRFGQGKGHVQYYRGKCETPFVNQAKVEIVVQDEMLDEVLAILWEKAQAAAVLDDTILVSSPEYPGEGVRTVQKKAAAG